MEIHQEKRKIWSAKEKLAFMALLSMPQIHGKPKTISEIVKNYAVTPKTLYEWIKLYKSKGPEAFNDEPRKLSTSKSNNLELQTAIFNIALLNPSFSAKEIIKNLSPAHRRITEPTVQKILKLRDLNTLKKDLSPLNMRTLRNI